MHVHMIARMYLHMYACTDVCMYACYVHVQICADHSVATYVHTSNRKLQAL